MLPMTTETYLFLRGLPGLDVMVRTGSTLGQVREARTVLASACAAAERGRMREHLRGLSARFLWPGLVTSTRRNKYVRTYVVAGTMHSMHGMA